MEMEHCHRGTGFVGADRSWQHRTPPFAFVASLLVVAAGSFVFELDGQGLR